ncbi:MULTISPECIES: transcription termination factor Rho [unclassified Micromonospora]|uniref:transcription termination factor Rho n=1 Tax=unclassified Micromonospora TaxID=2617518 RepID=UPI00098D42A8|nr:MULTISPECIES: transcription termination factor Rho [unclassified Micromonospora]MDI5941741.1 transcription termination factor Rho [Micromonospora sp. DH15]OON29391.1 transcription termination factor Rho [Micromonospora sp. Rc5]
MSDTTDVTSDVSNVAGDATAAAPTRRRRSGTGLSAMLLPELQSLAASLGISGTARMRKGELISAISERQGGAAAGTPRPRAEATAAAAPAREEVRAEVTQAPSGADQNRAPAEPAAAPAESRTRTRRSRAVAAAESRPAEAETRPAETRAEEPPAATPATGAVEPAERVEGRRERGGREQADRSERAERGDRAERAERGDRAERTDRAERGERAERAERTDRSERVDRGGDRNERGERADRSERGERDRNDRGERAERERGDRNERADRGDRNDRNDRGQRAERDNGDDDDEGGGRRGRRSRFRDRRRGRGERGEGDGAAAGGGGGGGREPQVSEDDVLVPVAGIIDVLDNYAFVRTTGYLAGPNDVYVSMSQIKKYGLRRGDAITGAVRAARDGEQRRDKYNPLVRLDTINGMEPDEARRRPEFYKLTPLYPQERLRLETEPHILTTRVIDLVMPLGKGQRALIVSPPKAGKTMVLQAIANAITHNNPECHLMVVLVDERPEEVTDMQRSVKGEVIAATFDRPPQDHTTVAELAIERAKRLVELGHDVVVLLDSVTRLGRSYNLAAPASGRIMSGGIDSTALYPPKRFLGAARNIENGGSLTILATALVETGSMADTVIFEEFKGTGNAELKLDRKIADKRTFPAVDVSASGTRKEEILLAPEELAIIHKLRKVLHSLDSQAALDLLLDRLKQSRTNIEFLMQIAKSTPGE